VAITRHCSVTSAWAADVPLERLGMPELAGAATTTKPDIGTPGPIPVPRWTLEVGGGPFLTSAGTGVRAEAEIRQVGRALGFRIDGIFPRTRARALDAGTVHWRRTSFAAVAVARVLDGPFRCALDAGPLLSAVVGEGRGYAVDSTDATWSAGLTGGGRLAIPLGGIVLWLDGRALYWPVTQRLRIVRDGGPAAATHAIDTTELQGAIGLSVRAF